MRDNFWQTAAGDDATRMMQNHYADILLALKEHSFALRETNKSRSDYLRQLADNLYTRRPWAASTAAAKTDTEK